MGQFLQCLGLHHLNKLLQSTRRWTHPLPLHTALHTPSSLWGQTLNNTDSWDHSPEPEDVVVEDGGGRKKRNDWEVGGRELRAPAAACTVRSCEGVRRLRSEGRRGGKEERRRGSKREREREGGGGREREFGWQPCSLFHTKSGARLSVKCLCVPKHHYCLLRQ